MEFCLNTWTFKILLVVDLCLTLHRSALKTPFYSFVFVRNSKVFNPWPIQSLGCVMNRSEIPGHRW